MNFVGVDLAWGIAAGTGVCLLRDGRAVDSALLKTDEQVLDWVRPHTAGDSLVGFDAPLVVRNQTGRRPCESTISRCFHAYEAGAHSANLSLPAFVAGVRAVRLAQALDLSVDPYFQPLTPVRRAIEVYPHTALVALFGLVRTLKYKAKSGRTAESRRAAFAELIRHLEGLVVADPCFDVTTSPRWSYLRDGVTSSESNAALDRLEDEIDAYVCAYVALYYWTHGLAKARVVGDLTDGYIVTPVTAELGACIDGQAGAAGSADWLKRDSAMRAAIYPPHLPTDE